MGLLRTAFCVGALAYVALLVHEVYYLFYPPRCRGKNCFRAALRPGDYVDLQAYVGRELVWNVTNVSSSAPLTARFAVPIPPEIRQGYHSELQLRVMISLTGQEPLTAAVADLVRRMPVRVRTASMLLESSGDEVNDPFAGLSTPDGQGRVPHFLYSAAPVQLRYVTDVTPHVSPRLPGGGDPIGNSVDHQRRKYTPHFYVDTFSLLRRHAARETAPLPRSRCV